MKNEGLTYHSKPNDPVLLHQWFDKRGMGLSHVVIIFLLGEGGVAVSADCEAEVLAS